MTIFCLGVIGIYLSKIFIETKIAPTRSCAPNTGARSRVIADPPAMRRSSITRQATLR